MCDKMGGGWQTPQGSPKENLERKIPEDMRGLHLKEEDTKDIEKWRESIDRQPSNPATLGRKREK